MLSEIYKENQELLPEETIREMEVCSTSCGEC